MTDPREKHLRAFTEIQAKKILNALSADDLVAWALLAVESGLESKNLLMLAGIHTPGSSIFEVEPYFDRALSELGLAPSLDWERVLREYMSDVVHGIHAGEISPSEGIEAIHRFVVTPLGHPEDLAIWCRLWEGNHPVTWESLGDAEQEELIRTYAEQFVRTGE